MNSPSHQRSLVKVLMMVAVLSEDETRAITQYDPTRTYCVSACYSMQASCMTLLSIGVVPVPVHKHRFYLRKNAIQQIFSRFLRIPPEFLGTISNTS